MGTGKGASVLSKPQCGLNDLSSAIHVDVNASEVQASFAIGNSKFKKIKSMKLQVCKWQQFGQFDKSLKEAKDEMLNCQNLFA